MSAEAVVKPRLADLRIEQAYEEGRRVAILCALGGRGRHEMVGVPTFRSDGRLNASAVAYLVGTWAIRRAP